MNYREKAQAWYERGLTEPDDFVRFILFYISLEVFMKLQGLNIRSLKERRELFHSIPQNVISKLKEKLDVEPHINMNPDGDHRWDGKLTSTSDFDGVVEFVVRARNNLFHGDKVLNEKRDLFIVEYGNKILEPLLKSIFSS